MKNYNKTSLSVLLALGVVVTSNDAQVAAINQRSTSFLDNENLAIHSLEQKQKAESTVVASQGIDAVKNINFTSLLTPLFMHAQQGKSHAQVKSKTKSDYDSLFEGDEAGGDGFMTIDGQKIKNDGIKKPGTDVTFDEKPKVEIKANVFPVRDNTGTGNTAVVQKKEDDLKVSTNTTTPVVAGKPSEATASDSTTVVQKKSEKKVVLVNKDEKPKEASKPQEKQNDIEITKLEDKPKGDEL